MKNKNKPFYFSQLKAFFGYCNGFEIDGKKIHFFCFEKNETEKSYLPIDQADRTERKRKKIFIWFSNTPLKSYSSASVVLEYFKEREGLNNSSNFSLTDRKQTITDGFSMLQLFKPMLRYSFFEIALELSAVIVFFF